MNNTRKLLMSMIILAILSPIVISTASAYSEQCSTRTAKVSLDWAWTYNQKITWCHDGTKITRWVAEPDRYASYVFPTWSYGGVQATSSSGGIGKTYFRAWSQAKFSYVSNILFVNYYPKIEQIVYANGGYKETKSLYS